MGKSPEAMAVDDDTAAGMAASGAQAGQKRKEAGVPQPPTPNKQPRRVDFSEGMGKEASSITTTTAIVAAGGDDAAVAADSAGRVVSVGRRWREHGTAAGGQPPRCREPAAR